MFGIRKRKTKKITKWIEKHLHFHLHRHVRKHKHKHIHNFLHLGHHGHHHGLHLGELFLVAVFGFASLIFAGTHSLPNNLFLDYPLKMISTVECRVLYWNEMPDSCKIELPKIKDANYDAYKDDELYTKVYSVLWAASYEENWDQKAWSHDGVDIATARGTPLYSIGDGEIYYAGRQNGYGNIVKAKYVYNGEVVYAIYAHMDTIEVEKWDTIAKWERVGTVGNSGNTFWALGWYHVHFELTKDNYGRPMYSYLGCEDLNKGHTAIINNGLCRQELFAHQYDPIKEFERGYIDTNDNTQLIDNTPVEDDTHASAQDEVEIVKPKEEVVDNGPKLLALDFTKLNNDTAKHFISQWNIEIVQEEDNINVGQSSKLKLKVTKKGSDQKFSGILPMPINIIPTNNNVKTNLSSIQFISWWEKDIVVSGTKEGSSSLILNLGNTKIGKAQLTLK